MKKEDIKNKAFLSWDLEDYNTAGEEPPACVFRGQTEGEIMEPEDIIEWSNDQIRAMSVLREAYPNRYEQTYTCYKLDLEYLLALGKISGDEKEKLEDKENFNFGQ